MSTTLNLPPVNDRDPMPKYLQAQRILTEAISGGMLPAGSKLPSTKEIGQLMNVSLITAHKALDEMAEAGLLRREAGRGTFVRDDVQVSAAPTRQLVIGLALDARANLNDFYHSSILNGLRQAAGRDSGHIEFYFQDHLRLPRRRCGDIGMICIHPTLESEKQVLRLADRAPTVVLGGSVSGSRVMCVDCDNRAGSADAVRYLYELGHRRMIMLSGPTNLSNARDRVEGALGAMLELGLEPMASDVLVSADSVIIDAQTQTTLHQRLRSESPPTAILAGGYFLALAAMHAARQVGLSIPEDVSVVGFDDPEAAPLLNPPLTTLRQPLAEMADAAFRLLMDRVSGTAAESETVMLPIELVVRETAGPPACD